MKLYYCSIILIDNLTVIQTLLKIQKQHKIKRDNLLKHKMLKKSKEICEPTTTKANNTKRKVSKRGKKKIETVFVGIHSRYWYIDIYIYTRRLYEIWPKNVFFLFMS